MWIPTNKTKRFTLYHLQQNEIYIRDFSGFCSYIDVNTNENRTRDKGKFYICSKTIVFQSDIPNLPLIKFKYEHMKAEPKLNKKSTNYALKPQADHITFETTRITTVKVTSTSPPQPFKSHEEYKCRILIQPAYEEATKVLDWIHQLYAYSKKKGVYDLEDKIYEWIIEKQNKRNFNMSLIESISEKPLHQETNIFVRRILPLNHLYGYFFVTDQRIYFEPFHSISGESVIKIDVADITRLFKRRYELREIGLEIITEKNSYYFTFDNTTHRNRLYNALVKKVSESCIKEESLQKITYQWQTKQISNFEYLMHLNQSGNRSFSDLSQYLVFPWIISQYTQEQIDLNDETNYRDLTKPIGALNQQRLQGFLERYEDMPAPKFMYGSHYSAPGYVIGYLLRKKPEYMLKLQSGKFDKADRLFDSIKGDWRNVIENPTSLKQLIPQFYQNDSSFLVNKLNLDLGTRQNKEVVNDVKLPLWAKGSPDLYLEINKKALESDYVSNNLHHWIDLIFGYKQRGQEAIKANNLFNYMTYEGMVDVEKIKDPIQKMSVKCQINQFGQCPKQIFKNPHPPRNSLATVPQSPSKQVDSDEQIQQEQNSKSTLKSVQVSSLYSSGGRPKVKTAMAMGKPSDIKTLDIPKAHKSIITKILPLSGKPNHVVTIGQDGFLKVYNLLEKNCLKSFKICDYCISAIVAIKGDEQFALGSWDNNLYLFNINFGSKSQPYAAHDNSISDLIFLQKKKRLVSSSWDCSIKTFRIVGNNFDNQQVFYDHDNQITNLTTSPDQDIIALGDIEGNVIVMSTNQQQKIYSFNLNNQKVIRLEYLSSNLVAVGQTQIKLLDPQGSQITHFLIEKSNGLITDAKLDSEHLFVVTNKKHLGLYDLLQEKKLGACFNDFRANEDDKLPGEKELTSVSVLSESTLVVVGSSQGNMYILRS